MDLETGPEQRGRQPLQDADAYLRSNPLPAVLGALAVGFAIGLLARLLEPQPRKARLRDHLEDAEDYLHSVWTPFAKKTSRAYHKSAKVVRGAVEDTVDRVRDVDVEDYTDPVVKWFRRFWKSCCD
jgi:hypothetical protein